MTRKIKVPSGGTGYGYVGRWSDNTIGQWLPYHLWLKGTDKSKRSCPETNYDAVDKDRVFLVGKRVFLCRITVKPVLDKRGRPITKIVRKAAQ